MYTMEIDKCYKTGPVSCPLPKTGCETITMPQILIWRFDNYGNYGNKKNCPRYNVNCLVTQFNVKSVC